KVHFAEEPAGAGGLVAGDTDEVAGLAERCQAGTHVGVEVGGVEVFTEPGVKAGLPFGVQVEVRTKVVEYVPVVFTAGDNGAEHRGEGVSGDTEPVGPGVI